MADFGQNHGIWSESGPYGSVLAHTHPFRIPYGLGCLWDASRPPKPPKNPKIKEIVEIREFPCFPYSCGVALKG